MVLCIVKTSKLKPLFIVTLAALLSSCAQQSPPSSSMAEIISTLPTVQPEATQTAPLSAAALYARAGQYQGEAQQHYLLKVAAAALEEQDSELALAITDTLRQSDFAQIRQRNQVLLLQAYLQHNELALAEQLISNTPLSQIATTDQPSFLWTSASLYQRQQRPYPAARNLLQLDALLSNNSRILTAYPELHEQLWQQLSAVTNTELANLREIGRAHV